MNFWNKLCIYLLILSITNVVLNKLVITKIKNEKTRDIIEFIQFILANFLFILSLVPLIRSITLLIKECF